VTHERATPLQSALRAWTGQPAGESDCLPGVGFLPRPATDSAAGGAGPHGFPSTSSDFSTGTSLTCLVSGLDLACGSSVWLDFAPRAGMSAAPAGTAQRVLPLFSRVFVPGVPETPSPTLKAGSGESRSSVRIPPHPIGFHSFSASRWSLDVVVAAGNGRSSARAVMLHGSRAIAPAAGSQPSHKSRFSIGLRDGSGMRDGASTRGHG
jgi:hypothetical protein